MNESFMDDFADADGHNSRVDLENDLTDPASLNRLTSTDCGQLPEATRRALVQLLRGPYISEERHSKVWATLLRSQDDIKKRLGDLFLELVIDVDARVAFVRNMEAKESELPKVVRSQRLTLLDTALVIFLREQLLNAEATGRRSFVGYTDIIDHLSVYRNMERIDEAAFIRRLRSSIEKMKNHSVLLSTAEDDRFEISPILRLVFDADQVIAVTKEIERMLGEGHDDDLDEEIAHTDDNFDGESDSNFEDDMKDSL